MNREYFYWIDGAGDLYHDGTLQSDRRFLGFFFRRLRTNDSGRHPEYPYLSPCGAEWNFVRSAGAPIVFRSLDNGRLLYAGGELAAPLDPERLTVNGGGALCHPAANGLSGRLAGAALQEITERISEGPEGYELHWQGRCYLIRYTA